MARYDFKMIKQHLCKAYIQNPCLFFENAEELIF